MSAEWNSLKICYHNISLENKVQTLTHIPVEFYIHLTQSLVPCQHSPQDQRKTNKVDPCKVKFYNFTKEESL